MANRNPNLDLPIRAIAGVRVAPAEIPAGDGFWTGKAPRRGECPGMDASGVLRSLPLPDTARASRQEVLDYFDNGWALTEVLFSTLKTPEAFLRPPYHGLRHPMIFYYAHPAAVYVNKMRLAGLLTAPIDPCFEQLFETGVDEMSWDDISKNEMPWPPVAEVHAYRARVYQAVRRVLAEHPGLAPGHPPILRGHPLWACFMGFEHERIHIETSSVLIRELPLRLVRRPDAWPPLHPSAAPLREDGGWRAPEAGRDHRRNELVPVPPGAARLGKRPDFPSYGWDNEYGERACSVRAFAASTYKIQNGELYEFVLAGGYTERRYWTEEGWRWRTFRNAKWPTFWVPLGPAGLHRYALRTCFEIVQMPWSWPAEVNYHEARAYCAFRAERDGAGAYRLITESEHHRLRGALAADPAMAASGHEMAAGRGPNLALAWGSPGPVDSFAPTAGGFHDVLGNVWEWCEDHFNPLPGFTVDPLYDDFSTPCFDGEHQMILGGSFVSTGDEASAFARFHFRPHFFQHAGFRLARCEGADPAESDAVRLRAAGVYETRRLLDEYLQLHFGADADGMPFPEGPAAALGFPERCARLVIEAARGLGVALGRALDLGCAVGRASFELAREFEEVVGVDLSASFLAAASALKRDGVFPFSLKEEGELASPRRAVVDAAIDRGRVTFRRADACALPADLAGFDAVLLANLLCRLPSPRACLSRLGGARGLVRPGGVAVIVSPYSWSEEFSPRDAWLGGREVGGRLLRGRDGILAELRDEFELLRELDVPLLIREHARKYQLIVSHAMILQRRAPAGAEAGR